LLAAASAPGVPLSELDAFSEADRPMLAKLRGADRSWPFQTVLDMVAQHTHERPHELAVQDPADDGRGTSYGELAALASGIRRELSSAGVGPGDVVAVHAVRGPLLPAAVLGVWAAGAAFVPLDPKHPRERLRHQLLDSGSVLVLTDSESDSFDADVAVLSLREVDPGDGQLPPPRAETAAYIFYTSGSTGRPKGVVVSHRSFANQIQHFAEVLGRNALERVLWLTTFSFDPSALELFLALATGTRLVVAPDEARYDASAFGNVLVATRPTLVQATPTTWREIADGLSAGCSELTVLAGGEPLTDELASRLLDRGVRLFQVYGPTETTVWATMASVCPPVDGHPGIGYPIANTNLEIRDPHGRRVPPGMPGEAFIGGAGVAIGYHRDATLTAARFPEGSDGRRCYRTGDIVRLGADGLEFLGRRDRQVKIRGNRIELAEVEAAVNADPRVRAAAVLVVPDATGRPALAAFCRPMEPSPDPALPSALRAAVAERLPAAMVPGRIVVQEHLPLTATGKIDYGALAALLDHIPSVEAGGGTPLDGPLQTMIEMWREVLRDPTIGADSDFFLHGGQSLLAMQLVERVNARFDARLEFEAVFAAPTPALMRECLDEVCG
jgi:amino acid adenylation domain-containing protein